MFSLQVGNIQVERHVRKLSTCVLSWLLIRERGIFMTGTSQEEIRWLRICGYFTDAS